MRFQHNPFTDKLDITGMGPGSTDVQFVTGNDGVHVPADSGYNINIVGNNSQGIDITGDIPTNTVTVAGISATTSQIGVQANATNAQAASQSATDVSLTPSNITSLFSTNPVPPSQGGSGLSSPAAHQLMVTEGSSNFTLLGVATNGQIPIGSAASDPVLATLTAGTGIDITNGPGSITIAATGADNTFNADSGSATPVGGIINLDGTSAQGISTSASGNTVTWTIADAATGQKGVVALATNAEAIAGADTAKAITSEDLKAKLGTQTAHGILVGAGTSSAITALGAATNGQIPIGSTGVDPVLSTITAGAGIAVTNGSGSITIAATGAGFTWTDVTGTSQTIAVENGYLSDNVGTVTFTLPASANLGDTFSIVGVQGQWTIAQNANQQIKFGSSATTVGVGGSLSSTDSGDCVTCVATNTGSSTVWRVKSAIGNLTVV